MNLCSTLDEIKILYKRYIDDPVNVYKKCRDQWIVIMKPLPGTRTNESRDNVRDPGYAKFRANKLKVLVIFSIFDPSKRMRAIINTYDDTVKLKYKVNKIVRPDNFDNNLNRICAGGVHYFKSIDAAFYWGSRYFKSGHWCQWYSDGQIGREGDYQDGKQTGHWCSWYSDGQIESEGDYQDGKRTGHWRAWHANGQIKREGDYQDDKQTSHWCLWYSDGRMHVEGYFQNGKRTGHCCSWYSNGQMITEGDYQDDKQTGHWCSWYPCGQMNETGDYQDGKQTGHGCSWHENGQIESEGDYQDGKRTGHWCSWYPDGQIGCKVILVKAQGKFSGKG
jgi:antitoxin component YwqK of YwqJK toxin-antitoxin module